MPLFVFPPPNLFKNKWCEFNARVHQPVMSNFLPRVRAKTTPGAGAWQRLPLWADTAAAMLPATKPRARGAGRTPRMPRGHGWLRHKVHVHPQLAAQRGALTSGHTVSTGWREAQALASWKSITCLSRHTRDGLCPVRRSLTRQHWQCGQARPSPSMWTCVLGSERGLGLLQDL